MLLRPVHAKNTENTDGQKNEIQRKNKENYYSRPKFRTKKKLYFENSGTEGSVFYCIFSNTTGKCLYWLRPKTPDIQTNSWLKLQASGRDHFFKRRISRRDFQLSIILCCCAAAHQLVN
jgi:hypothetical protein